MKTSARTLALAGLCWLAADMVLANPVGESVRSGSATFNRGPGTLTILQGSSRVAINWRDFSIAGGEVTRFVQPSSRSVALNRVTTGNPSLLYGSLQANGRVYLINQNGILVGPNGSINTRAFMGSTLDGPDEQLLKGARLTLSGNSSAAIRNEGTISALGGSVYLVAHTVDNAGSIRAPQGQVGLVAASEVILHDTKGAVGVVAGRTTGPPSATGVNNSGLIEAASAQLQAAGGNIYALAINNSGVVRANTLVRENGRILLKATGGNIRNTGTLSARNAHGQGGSVVVDAGHQAGTPTTVENSGTMDARGAEGSGRGGRVQITGDQIQLGAQSRLDASGGAAGGTVLVGGDAHGANPAVQNAQTTTMAEGA
ncbi:MAG TPA: filamentous hemagglutinin N-terminal domain-containing protein, partial [Candidatus Saccharimonadales bacterium]|nr:filamentous hemagglutinin N-terminal domain-containing protein [Candidatus Saccharimonadales bacterium]